MMVLPCQLQGDESNIRFNHKTPEADLSSQKNLVILGHPS